MEIDENHANLSDQGISVLAEYSIIRLSLFCAFFIAMTFALWMGWMTDCRSCTLPDLFIFTPVRYFYYIFSAYGALVFGIIIFRAAFMIKSAVYISGKTLFIHCTFYTAKIDLRDILSIKKDRLLGLIIIKRRKRGQCRYHVV